MSNKSVLILLATAFSILPFGSLMAQIPNPIQAAKDALKKAGQPAPAGQPPQSGQQTKAGQQAPASGNPATNENGPFSPPPGTRIEATLLSPPLPGAGFAVSPLGIHMATVTHSGSRLVVLYDNVEGPKFDQILGNGSGGIAFSPDGSHFAYCGQQGNEVVVMEDGKEVWRSSETNVQGGFDGNSCGAALMHFTSNNKHLYFEAASRYNSTLASRFVIDGQAGPQGAGDFSFSPDGEHYAYIWGDPANHGNVQNVKVIIDGKPAPYVGGNLQWSADSKHLYSIARGSGAVDLLFDGKSIAHANDIRLFVPPIGDMTVAVIARAQPQPATWLLAVGNKPVPGSESQTGAMQNVTISRDGKHYAAQSENANHQKFVFWDGKKGQTYRNLIAFKAREEREARYFDFTPDGRVIYLADDLSALQYLVIGDKESDQIRGATEVVVSATGRVMANSMGNASNGAGINLDGKYLQLPYATSTGYLGFSPDGNHYAFVLQSRDSNQVVYLDGVAQPNTVAIPTASNTAYVFSPDSKHLAYFYHAGNDLGICVDGKCVAGGNTYNYFNLTFSADSNHLFCVRNSAGHYRLFVDGKAVFESGAPASQTFPKETWQTNGPSGLLVLAHDNDGYKRITITPSLELSLATMR
jgi:hypothetical protein